MIGPLKDALRKDGISGLARRLMKGDTDDTVIQMFRYLQVAFVAFAVDFGSLWVFTEYVGQHYLISNVPAFMLGVTTNYLLSIRWVFKGRSTTNRRAEVVIYVSIGVAGLALNELFLFLFTSKLGLHYMISKFVATGIVFFFNFFVRKFVLFNKKKDQRVE